MTNLNKLLDQLITYPVVGIFFLAWLILWKGLALWKAARNKHLTWFAILLVVNTVGLLEIAYIFFLNRWDIGNAKLLAFVEKKFKPCKKS